jgi:hypothetical protein
MDRRKAWREQEAQLVERWNAAEQRYREAQAAMSSQCLPDGSGVPSDDSLRTVEAARAELDAMRKQVARLKVEFSSGKRY